MSGQKFTAFHTMKQNLYFMKTDNYQSQLNCDCMTKMYLFK